MDKLSARHFISIQNIIILLVFEFFFHSAYALPECSETLSEAFTAMVNSNPDLDEARANQEATWDTYQQLRAGYFPVVAVTYNVGRGKGISVSPQTFNIGYTVANIQHKQITISQTLFDGGVISGHARSGEEKYNGAEFETVSQLNQLALKTSAAFLAVLRGEEMEHIAYISLKIHKQRAQQIGEKNEKVQEQYQNII